MTNTRAVSKEVKHKAVFLDKDGTLIPDIPYNVDTGKIVIEKETIEAIRLLRNEKFLLVVISNQPGIAKGYFTEDQLQEVWNHLSARLQKSQLSVDAFYYCPHHPEGSIKQYTMYCDCHKPSPGLLIRAAKDFHINLGESWMIGDILHDVESGNRAGCKTILIDNGNETEWEMTPLRRPTGVAANLLEAACFIIQQKKYAAA